MVNDVIVMNRVQQRHLDVSNEDVLHAWHYAIKSRSRLDKDPIQYIAVGVARDGRMLEMCAYKNENDDYVIFHAMTATRKVLRELGLQRRH